MRGHGVLWARESKGKLARPWGQKVAFIAVSSAGKDEKGVCARQLPGKKEQQGGKSELGTALFLVASSHRFNNPIFLLCVCVGPEQLKVSS